MFLVLEKTTCPNHSVNSNPNGKFCNSEPTSSKIDRLLFPVCLEETKLEKMALDTNSKEVPEPQNPAPGKVKSVFQRAFPSSGRGDGLSGNGGGGERRPVRRHGPGIDCPCERKGLGLIRPSAPCSRDSLHRYRAERGNGRRPEP